MKPLSSSVALRLTIWFLLLSILPMAVLAVFVRRNVFAALEQVAIVSQRNQAAMNAGHIAALGYDESYLREHISHSQPVGGEHFLVDEQGVILFHPNPDRVGVLLSEFYSPESLQLILADENGGFIDQKSGHLVGFSHIAGRNWVDIVAIGSSVLTSEIGYLTRISSLQLALSLIVVAFAGGLVIWFLVGHPLRKLTWAAKELGQGNLDVELDASVMEDELNILAIAFNESRLKIRSLVNGLEQQLKELEATSASLRDSEARFRTIFDSINDAILVKDFSSDSILDVNSKFCEMFGYQPDDLRHLSVKNLLGNDGDYDYKNMRRMIRHVKRLGPQVFEWRARRKDGTFFWVEISMHVASLSEGVQHLVVVARDIDQRKNSQQAQVAVYRVAQVAQVKPTLYEFFSSIHQILQTLIPAPNFLVALYRGNDDEIYYPYHLDEREIWPSAQQNVDRLLLRKMREMSGVLWINADNSHEYLDKDMLGVEVDAPFEQWLGVPLQTAHGLQGALVMKYYNSSVHLTEIDVETLSLFSVQVAAALERRRAEDALRESEARWRTLMQSSPQLIVTVNRGGQVIFINRPLVGLLPGAEAQLDFFQLMPGETLQDKKELLEQVFSRRKPVAFEFRLSGPEQAETWFSANLAPVVDRGHVELAILNAMDITQRKAAEDEVWRLNERLERRVKERTSMLEAANMELESFSYSISHDLRAPLRAINGFSRILEDEIENGEPETRQRYLALIRENAQQMGVLIDDLLSFSRLGRQAINLAMVSTREMVSQALYTLDSELQGRDVLLSIADLPDCVCDAALIKQVWMNLLSNAVKFTRQREEARIEIDFELREGEVVYIVRDNGTGFDMKYADKLFGVFQRLHRAEEFEGTGVGLAIVHRIVTRHGGRVWAESVPGEGSTFYFSLPLQNGNPVKKQS